jgi:uncharacterized protein (TIGR03032 family)
MTPALAESFDRQGQEWRDPLSVVAQWSDASHADPNMLAYRTRGAWWSVLEEAGVTLIVSREYEHLLLAISARPKPRFSFMRLPHPSGITFDETRGELHVASTRNPNQLYTFAAVDALLARRDGPSVASVRVRRPIVPRRTLYLPGCYYLHDLAMIGGVLHANSVGQNVVVAIADGAARAVWWPEAIERLGVPQTDRNVIQLNSIAAGADLASSYFTASGPCAGRYRPGHARYPVDGRGVLFGGATRRPVVAGLTRPHSARIHNEDVWIADSGYGTLVAVRSGAVATIARFPGWTRGLGFARNVAFVGTSRVIPRFRQYAPGLDVDSSRCGIHAVDPDSGRILGSIEFPSGNQIFAITPVPAAWSDGFPFTAGRRALAAERRIFYAFDPQR